LLECLVQEPEYITGNGYLVKSIWKKLL